MALVEVQKPAESQIQRYDKILNSAQKILIKLGLTENESRVYAYLNINGSKKAKDISKDQRIPRTETYHLLTALHKKGLVTMISERITIFEGIEFEKVLDILISNELKRIEELQFMRNELNELWKLNF
ncbi:MAG TPA: TrmB family transcriptional regulator [Nitrosopumilus sp.]|nr:TrmB family transcriptional regulator [Thermoproteota archaeon]HJJ23205.1 TrmB family transcriptional regulator [Nitrosopumilus sp.]